MNDFKLYTSQASWLATSFALCCKRVWWLINGGIYISEIAHKVLIHVFDMSLCSNYQKAVTVQLERLKIRTIRV